MVVGCSSARYSDLVSGDAVSRMARAGLATPAVGILFMFLVLTCAAVTATVRLHPWFTARFYPSELATQRNLARAWTWASDLGFSATLLLAAFAIAANSSRNRHTAHRRISNRIALIVPHRARNDQGGVWGIELNELNPNGSPSDFLKWSR